MYRLNMIVGLVVLVCAGCASRSSVPPWGPNPPKSKQAYYAVGFAHGPNEAKAWKEAERHARDNLAFQIRSEIKSEQKYSFSESGAVFESITKQVSSVVIWGAYTMKRAIGPNDTYYVLIACRKDYVEERISDFIDAETAYLLRSH